MALDAGFARTMHMTRDTPGADSLRDPTASALRGRAAADPKSVIKAAAKQFEALLYRQHANGAVQTRSERRLDRDRRILTRRPIWYNR